MPLYSFKNKQTGEITTEKLLMTELDDFKANNPDLIQLLNAPKLVDPYTVGRVKTDDAFQDLLKETKKAHYKSTINHR